MLKTGGSDHSSKIKCWIEKYPELKSNGKMIFCSLQIGTDIL